MYCLILWGKKNILNTTLENLSNEIEKIEYGPDVGCRWGISCRPVLSQTRARPDQAGRRLPEIPRPPSALVFPMAAEMESVTSCTLRTGSLLAIWF